MRGLDLVVIAVHAGGPELFAKGAEIGRGEKPIRRDANQGHVRLNAAIGGLW